MRKRATLELAGALGGGSTDKRVEILRRVQAVGSISQAAREAGVSYKAAWQALDTLSNLAGLPLVERAVGGTGGGGAVVTEAGMRLLAAADALARARDEVLAGFGATGPSSGVAALALRTSMRNQLPCSVRAVRTRAGALDVELALAGGGRLLSRITRESVQLLGLARGVEALALCKATAVEILASPRTGDLRNALAGTVVRASRAAAGGECAVELAGGLRVVGFAAGLRVGQAAVACVDAAAVVVARAG